MADNKVNPTIINGYFEWLESVTDTKSDIYNAVHPYLEKKRKENLENGKKHPFLSVITRTQGKRPEMLTETLLCLTGQSDTDFELLVMGHNLSEQQSETVNRIIGDLPAWMQDKTRLIPVNGGTRTTPLNCGFEAANGEYIAILDDDDIVFDNWVEEFRSLSKENAGQVLHTYAIYQDWETVKEDCPRAAGAPKNTFCKNFEMMSELVINVCPPVCLAFPADCFEQTGIHFDETLTTNEDWDYLMRTAFFTGVANKAVTTCIYRNWLNAENSQTVHNKKEWDDNYKKIINKFINTPIVLPSGSLKKNIDLIGKPHNFISTDNVDDIQMFYDDGSGFSANKTMTAVKLTDDLEDYSIAFENMEELGDIKSVRIDPYENGDVFLEKLRIKVICKDKSEHIFDEKSILTNGYKIKKGIAFVKSDPQLIIGFSIPVKIDRILLSYDLFNKVSDEMIDEILNHHGILYKFVRKAYHFIRRVFGR